MILAATESSLEPIFSLLFWAVVIVGGIVFSAKKKQREARLQAETQEQLQRVDEAIRAARERAQAQAVAAQERPRFEAPSVPYEVTSPATQSYSVASPSFRPTTFAVTTEAIPVALPVEASEGPSRPGAWEAARSGARKRDEDKQYELVSPTAASAAAGFAPASAEEFREALAWREIFAPCVGMRR